MAQDILVVGAGQAAIAFAAKIRETDSASTITMIGDEPSLPYQRPPLSKKYMIGELERDRLLLRPDDWYETNNVACVKSRRVEAIAPEEKTVHLDDGTMRSYDKLMIATGATPRNLPPALGGGIDDVHVLRTMADADAIGVKLEPGRRLLIVGGGYIGLEVAAVAVARGLTVRIAEMADRILQRVASPATSDIFRNLHQKRGVEITEATTLTGLAKSGTGLHADFAGGEGYDCDLAIAAIGVMPNDNLARMAGLAVDNGIVVDEFARTSDPDIHAAGDCASFMFHGNRIRLESVQNAIEQADILAARNLTGEQVAYDPVPWFWSDQYDVKLQIAGLHIGYDRTVERPGSHEGGRSVWYYAGERFVAVDAINDPRAYMTGKRLLEHGKGPTAEQAADPGFDLKSLLK